MYISRSQKKIVGAILFGTTVIALALILKREPASLNNVTVVNGEPVVVTKAPERNAIPIADSNGDGVPDWQEALQVTEAIKTSSSTTPYITPNTLTDQFALEFFEQMVRNESNGAFSKSPKELVAALSAPLAAQATDPIITAKQILVSTDNSAAALTAYGEAVAQIIITHDDPSGENEAIILERALRDSNPEELKKLDGKIDVYTDVLNKTLSLSVPSAVKAEHLLLVNAYQAILGDLYAMQNAFNDPMHALLRMKRYQDDATVLGNTLVTLATKLTRSGATWNPGSPMLKIISISQ
jgi:hypothetical protein